MRTELSIETLFDLFADFGRFGPLAGPTFQLRKSTVSRLTAATHYRRAGLSAWSSTQASIAFAIDPHTPSTLWAAALILGGRNEGQIQLAHDALDALKLFEPTAPEIPLLKALQGLQFSNFAMFETNLAILGEQRLSQPMIDGLNALKLAMADDFLGASKLLAPYTEALKLPTNPEYAGRDWRARFAEKTYDAHGTYTVLRPWFNAEPTAELGLRTASAMLKAGMCYDAIAVLDALPTSAHSFRFYSTRAKARRHAGRLPESAQDYEAAFAGKMDDALTPRQKAEVLLDRAELETQQNKHVSAIASLDQALDLSPKLANGYVRRGHMKQNVLRYAEAALDFAKALELEPLDCPSDIFALIATSLFNARKYQAAAEAYLTAIDEALNDPSDSVNAQAISSHWEHRGVCFHFLNQLPEAVECYTEALRIHPDNTKALSDRGEALLALGRDEAAIVDLDRATDGGYKIGCTMLAKGEYFQRKNQHTKALAALDEACTLWPTSPLPFESRAKTREALANHNGARDDREKAAVLRAAKAPKGAKAP